MFSSDATYIYICTHTHRKESNFTPIAFCRPPECIRLNSKGALAFHAPVVVTSSSPTSEKLSPLASEYGACHFDEEMAAFTASFNFRLALNFLSSSIVSLKCIRAAPLSRSCKLGSVHSRPSVLQSSTLSLTMSYICKIQFWETIRRS